MSSNPITQSPGGIFRFTDYISQVPDFLKSEKDTVTLLQVLSDYINNAYRNISATKKFKFKLISTESNVYATSKTLQKLADLFKLADSRGTKMLYLAKPPYTNPTDRTYDTANPTYTQDPFNSPATVDKLFPSQNGRKPRIIEFSATDISDISIRKIPQGKDSVLYFELFFTATIDGLKDVQSLIEVSTDQDGNAISPYLVDYYNDIFPSDFSTLAPKYLSPTPPYHIKFIPDLDPGPFNWGSGSNKFRLDTCESSPIVPATFWISPTGIVHSTVLNLPGVDAGMGMYGTNSEFAFSNSTNSYAEYKSVSADVYLLGRNGTNSDFRPLAAIGLGASESEQVQAKYSVGLTAHTDSQTGITSVYFVVYNTMLNIALYKEQVFQNIETELLLGGSVKVTFTSSIIKFYWNGTLKFFIPFNFSYPLPATPLTANPQYINFSVRQLGGSLATDTINGLIDNINIQADDPAFSPDPLTDPLSPTIEVVDFEISGLSLFYARDLTAIDKSQNNLNQQRINRYLDPVFSNSEDVSLAFEKLEDDLDHPFLIVPYKNKIGSPFVAGQKIAKILSGPTISLDSFATIKQVNILTPSTGTLVITGNYGDWISNQLFGVIPASGIPLIQAQIDSYDHLVPKRITAPWDFPLPYEIGRTVSYKGLKYRVIQAHTSSEETPPDKSPIYYETDMLELIAYDKKVTRNPYMWGLYRTVHLGLDSSPSLDAKSISELQQTLYVQNAEESGLKFFNKQREWLFNPRVANKIELARNGWLEVTNNKLDSENDLVSTDTTIDDFSVLYCKQNLFDVTLNNPELAPDNGYYKYTISQIGWQNKTTYEESSFPVSKDPDTNEPYNIGVTVNSLFGEQSITVESSVFSVDPASDKATVSINLPTGTKVFLATTGTIPTPLNTVSKYFVLNVSPTEIYFLKRKGDLLINRENLITPGVGVHTLSKKFQLKDGDVVNLTAQKRTISITSLTAFGTTATAETDERHGLKDGDKLDIIGAASSFYNISDAIVTVVDDYSFTYVVSNLTPASTSGVILAIFHEPSRKYRVVRNGPWKLLDKKVVMKIRSIAVDFEQLEPVDVSDDPVAYSVFGNSAIDIYKLTIAPGVSFPLLSLTSANGIATGITTIPHHFFQGRKIKVSLDNGSGSKFNYEGPVASIIDANTFTFPVPLSAASTASGAYTAESFHIPVYKIEAGLASNFKFMLESIDGIDTTRPLHLEYDARFDANTISDTSAMTKSFQGIPDMDMPMIEKIERLAYQKDPNVIDIKLIGYLARYLGYDITQISEDISESGIYKTENEREMALRKTIQNLPQFNALKSTKSGLDSLLLTFGIVGEVIKLWTRQDDAYSEFIPEYNLSNYIYSSKEQNGRDAHLIPTPHFYMQIDISNGSGNDLSISDVNRINNSIIRYKPINTVFDGIVAYLTQTFSSRISMGPTHMLGSMSFDIGYDIDFTVPDP